MFLPLGLEFTESIHENIMFHSNVDGAMHFIYLHKYNTNLAEDSSDMN